ncbi:hypothetical protein VTI74DRAFT_9744 [Chaetomium olivicolor]
MMDQIPTPLKGFRSLIQKTSKPMERCSAGSRLQHTDLEASSSIANLNGPLGCAVLSGRPCVFRNEQILNPTHSVSDSGRNSHSPQHQHSNGVQKRHLHTKKGANSRRQTEPGSFRRVPAAQATALLHCYTPCCFLMTSHPGIRSIPSSWQSRSSVSCERLLATLVPDERE